MKHLRSVLVAFVILYSASGLLRAQVPQLINYQGKVGVGNTNFDGTGQFKFALVNGTGATTYWSNDGTSTAGSLPTAAVSHTVAKGLYSVLLGDATPTNMTVVPSAWSSTTPACACASGATMARTAPNSSRPISVSPLWAMP